MLPARLPVRPCVNNCACSRVWACVPAYVSLRACVRTGAWVFARLHLCVAYAYVSACTYASVRGSGYMCARKRVSACVPACARYCVRAYVSLRASVHACVLPAHAWIHVRVCTSARASTYASVSVCTPAGTCTRAPVRKHVLARLREHERLSLLSCIGAHACAFARARGHTCACTCVRTPTQTSVRVYTNEGACVPLRACMHTCANVCERVCVREHLHELTCMCAWLLVCACCLHERASLSIRVCGPACACASAFLQAGLHDCSCAPVGLCVFSRACATVVLCYSGLKTKV